MSLLTQRLSLVIRPRYRYFENYLSLFPYLLLFITLSMAFLEATWRFSDLDKLVSVLDFVIDGLEESIRDVIEFLVEEDGGSRIALNGEYFR